MNKVLSTSTIHTLTESLLVAWHCMSYRHEYCIKLTLCDSLAIIHSSVLCSQSSGGTGGGGRDGDLHRRVKELEEELLETKTLYTTTLEDYEPVS